MPTPAPRSAALIVAGLALLAPSAQAVDVHHFEAAPGPHGFLVTQDAAVLPHLGSAGRVLGGWAHRPLVLVDDDGRVVRPVIDHLLVAEAAASLGLFDVVEIGAAAPAAFASGPGLDGRGLSLAAPGDPRLLAKVRLVPWNDGLVAAARASVTLPFASLVKGGTTFAGEALPQATAGLTLGLRTPWLRTSVEGTYVLRAPARTADLTLGHEIAWGAAAEATVVPDAFFVLADVYGRVAPRALFSSADQFPVEAAIAARAALGPVDALAGVGGGLVAGYGTPAVRVFVGFGWRLDGNERAAAPALREPEAPPPPAQPADADEDGLADPVDACPGEAEDVDRVQDDDGCPDPDNDGDGVLDEADACPNDPESENGVEDDDGCPELLPAGDAEVVVRRDSIEIFVPIFFEKESDVIDRRSHPILDRVAEAVLAHEEIAALRIEGHADADGPADYNQRLSSWRALSVKRYLVQRGVDPARLSARGFGVTRPAAPNDSLENKAKNRRVDFRIVQERGEPDDDLAAATIGGQP